MTGNPSDSPIEQIKDAAEDVADSEALGWWARLGLASRATVYVLIGVLAILLAQGAAVEADQKGALTQLLSRPFGTVLVWLMAIGFLGYALWRFSEAAFGVVGHGKETMPRLQSAGRGIAYVILTATAVSVLRGSSSSQSEAQSGLVAQVLTWPGGQWLVAAAGLGTAVVGVMLIREGWTKRFMRYFKGVPANVRSAVVHLGRVGTMGRGVVFLVVGLLIVNAGVRYEPDKAGGIDTAVQTILAQPYGRVLTVLAGLALLGFGIYGYAEARYRRV